MTHVSRSALIEWLNTGRSTLRLQRPALHLALRSPLSSILITLTVSSFMLCQRAEAGDLFPYHLSSPGDQSSARLRVSNLGSTPRLFKFGPRGGQRAAQTLNAYKSRDYLIKCLRRNDVQVVPELEFTLDERDQRFDPWITYESDPLRVIWNQGAPQSANRLKWPLRSALKSVYNRRPLSVIADDFLPKLSVWSHTQLFLTSLKALSDLNREQRFMLKIMVAMGVTLVIGTGDIEGEESLLQEFIPVGLGEVKSSEGALLELLPRVSSYRRLFRQSGSYPIVIADEEPIALESEYGLGRVRVVAVRLNEITRSEVATRLFRSDRRAKRQLQQWLDLSMAPISAPHRLLHDSVWLIIFAIPLLFLFSRREWRVLTLGGVMWITVALLSPPLFSPTSIRQANLLYIPMRTDNVQEGAIVLGQVDLNSFDRGGRVQELNQTQLSLISADTQGACLMHTLSHGEQSPSQEDRARAWLVLDSDLGERQRFKYIAYVPRLPNRSTTLETQRIPRWPTGPWSGSALIPLTITEQDMMLTANLSGVKAWRVAERDVTNLPEPLKFMRTSDDDL